MTQLDFFASTAIGTGVVGLASLLIIQQYAKRDIVFTQCLPGEAKILVKGGDLSDVVLNKSGYHLNVPDRPYFDPEKPKWEILPNRPGLDDADYEYRRFPMAGTGTYWVGFLRKVYEYPWNWMERNQHQNDENARKYIFREAMTRRIIVSDFVYFFETEEVETKDGLLVKMLYSLSIRINNPVKAVFRADNWLVSIETLASKVGKDYIGEHDFLELRSEAGTTEATQKHFSEHVLEYNKDKPVSSEGPEGTQMRWGVTIVNVNVEDVSLVGKTADENQDAARRLFLASRQAEANVREAEGRAQVTVIQANADKQATIARAEGKEKELEVLSKHSELAVAQMSADAIKGAGTKLVIAPGIIDAAAQPLGEILKNLGGKKAND